MANISQAEDQQSIAAQMDYSLGHSTIVTREFWGAREPAGRQYDLYHPIRHLWYIYDIGAPSCKNKEDCTRIVKLLQARCMDDMEMGDIPFNFLIGGDGRVYEGRGWFYQPPGFKRFEDHGCDRIDIGFISNRNKHYVTYQMIRASADLLELGLRQGYIAEDFQTTEWNKIGEMIKDDPNKPFG